MLVEINAPNEFQSAIHAMVAKRFGIVSAIDPREDWFTMMAEVNSINSICLDLNIFCSRFH